MLRKFNRKVFSRISVEENEDVIDAAPEVSANGEGTYDMSTPELENEKQELVELGDGIDAGVEEIETCCDDCETVIEIDNIVKDSVDSNNGLDQTSINIINTTVENMLKRHGLSRMRFRIPSVERYGRPLDKVKQAKVALEGIGDIFKWIWKKIKEIWEAICKFFRKLFGNSLNIFKKEIKQAYNAVMELKKDKKLLAKSLNASDDGWKKDNLKVTNNVEACSILQEVNNTSSKSKWFVGAANTIRLLNNKNRGVTALMNHPEFLKTEIDLAISNGSMIALDKSSSGKDVDSNKEVITTIYEHFELPEILIKHYRGDKDFEADLGYCVDPDGISEGVVDDLIRLVEGLKIESDKADEEALDKYMQQIEGSLTESIKKGRIKDDMKDDEKKKILESIKTTSSTIAAAVKNLYKYLIGYAAVVALTAANIKAYINLLKKENK